MNPYVEAQLRALIESVRLLEVYVTAPLGLYSDIRMIRESLDVPAAADLSREETALLRQRHSALTDDHASLALDAIATTRQAIETLATTTGSPLTDTFLRQSRLVLDRAAQKVGGDVRECAAERLRGIYVIVDPQATRGRPVIEVTAQSLAGGARVVQLRDKVRDKGPMLETARELKALCEEHDALFVMNDHADIAYASGADVLHVGQSDLPVADARRILSPRQMIGNSNGSMDEALRSWGDAVDYIAVGAIYATTTMGKSGRRALGPEMITRVKNAVSQPIVAIGGINAENIGDVARAGADSACVVSAITFADDVKGATEELAGIWEGAG